MRTYITIRLEHFKNVAHNGPGSFISGWDGWMDVSHLLQLLMEHMRC